LPSANQALLTAGRSWLSSRIEVPCSNLPAASDMIFKRFTTVVVSAISQAVHEAGDFVGWSKLS
jgi:hypothetical protein